MRYSLTKNDIKIVNSYISMQREKKSSIPEKIRQMKLPSRHRKISWPILILSDSMRKAVTTTAGALQITTTLAVPYV